MSNRAQAISIENRFQSLRTKSKSKIFRHLVKTAIEVLRAKPTEAEIAARKEKKRLMEEAWGKVIQSAPARVRQNFHLY